MALHKQIPVLLYICVTSKKTASDSSKILHQ